jgi:hypothetical protein
MRQSLFLTSNGQIFLFFRRKLIHLFWKKVMASKLPISRLRRQRHESSSGRRTSRACDICRERKVKCDGNQPQCSQCVGLGLSNCSYSERKLVRLQNELLLDRKKIENYEEVFRDLTIEFEGPVAERIQSALKVRLHNNCMGPLC